MSSNNSINDMIINPLILETLYGRTLVEIDSQPSKPVKPLKFLGNNARKTTVLVNNSDYAFLPEEQLTFLSRMLSACKLNTGDVAILNMANGATIEEIFEQLTPENVITFGIKIVPDVPVFTIGKLNNSAILQAPDLGELAAESDEAKLLKGKLWGCLKTLFNI